MLIADKTPFDAFFETIQLNQLDRAASLIASGFNFHTNNFPPGHPDHCPKPVTTKSPSLLQYAIRYLHKFQDSPMFTLIVKAGAPINALDDDGHTAVFDAIFANQTAALRYLLEHEADPHIINKRVQFPHNPMTYAIFKGHLECVKLLHEHGGSLLIPTQLPEFIRPYFKSPLHTAASHLDSLACLAYLLEQGAADLNTLQEHSQSTPLMLSVQKELYEHAVLLVKAGACISTPNAQGHTVFEMAQAQKLSQFIALFESHLLQPLTEGSLSTQVLKKQSRL